MNGDTDEHLPAIREGDAEAFARWMSSVEPTLRLSLRSFAASVDVESVLQEALLRTWSYAPRVVPDGKPNALFRVALRIARNLAVSEKRRLRPSVGGDDALLGLADDAAPTGAFRDAWLNNDVNGQLALFLNRTTASYPKLRTYGLTATYRF